MAKKVEKKQNKAASARAVPKKTAVSAKAAKKTNAPAEQKNTRGNIQRRPLTGSFKLSWQSVLFIKNYWKPLGGIVAIYALLNLFFASGLIGNASSVVGNIHSAKFLDALGSFSSLLTGSTNQTATMQSVLFVIESLVIIWALRHLFSGEQIGIKHAYYHSTSSLIPFVIVLFVIVLQLLPVTISSTVFAIVLSSITGNALVDAIFTFLFVASAFWSIYMLCSSVFALYIVTLPNMEPRSALKSAKNLVANRRWHVVRRLLFLPLIIIVVMGVFSVPLILYAKFLVTPTFFVLSMLSILFAHTYLYTFYKGLLENE
jgi:hypothetical protein